MSNGITVDDSSPSVTYSSPLGGVDWLVRTYPQAYSGTTHFTQKVGATLSFTFTGSSVTVFGTIGANDDIPALTSYSIDGGHTTRFTATSTSSIQWQVPFYRSGFLDGAGPHTLTITNEVEGDLLWIDFFVVTPAVGANGLPITEDSPNSPSTSQSHGPSMSANLMAVSVVTVGGSTITRTFSQSSSTSSSALGTTSSSATNLPATTTPAGHLPISASSETPGVILASVNPSETAGALMVSVSKRGNTAIIGGAVGGTLFLFAIVALVIWLLRRSARRRAATIGGVAGAVNPNPSGVRNAVISPFGGVAPTLHRRPKSLEKSSEFGRPEASSIFGSHVASNSGELPPPYSASTALYRLPRP